MSEQIKLIQIKPGIYTSSITRDNLSFIELSEKIENPIKNKNKEDFSNINKLTKEESDRLLEECWNETVKNYGDVLTALSK